MKGSYHSHFCDFCGECSEIIYRTVVDVEYDRVMAPAKYACYDCSQHKDLRREYITGKRVKTDVVD